MIFDFEPSAELIQEYASYLKVDHSNENVRKILLEALTTPLKMDKTWVVLILKTRKLFYNMKESDFLEEHPMDVMAREKLSNVSDF